MLNGGAKLMPKLGFFFPGQGAQYVGMGADIYRQYPEVRDIFDRAAKVLGYDLASKCFQGPAEELNRTQVTQPAILATSIAIFAILEARGIKPIMAAGLSLGEYTALVAARSIDYEDAIGLLAQRGRFMQEAVTEGEGAMMAVSGLPNETVEQICTEFDIEPANYNCPGQVVVAGFTRDVEAAGNEFVEHGARVAKLAVSVPSHCRLMKPAAERLAPCIQELTIKPSAFPVISNVSAKAISADNCRELLLAQLYSPVKWEQSMRLMLDEVDYVIEVGPGTVLSGLARRLNRAKVLGAVGDLASLEKVLIKVGEC